MTHRINKLFFSPFLEGVFFKSQQTLQYKTLFFVQGVQKASTRFELVVKLLENSENLIFIFYYGLKTSSDFFVPLWYKNEVLRILT